MSSTSSLGRVLGLGGSFASLGLAISAVLSLVSTGLVVANTEPTVYGNYASILSTLLLCSFVARFGVDRFAVKSIRAASLSEDKANLDEITAQMYLSVVLVGAISSVLAIVSMLLLRSVTSFGPSATDTTLVVVWFTFEAIRPIVMEILRSRLSLGLATFVGQLGRTSVIFVGVLAVVTFGSLTLTSLLFIGLLSSLLPTLFGLRGAVANASDSELPSLRITLRTLKSSFGTLGFYTLSGTGTLLIASGDILVVRSGSASEAAIYGAAVVLSASIGLVMTVVNTTVGPVLQQVANESTTDVANSVLQGITTLATLLAMVALVTALAVAIFLLPNIGGEIYREAIGLVSILALGQLAGVASGPCGTLLLLLGREKFVGAIIVATAVLAIGAEVLIFSITGSLTLVAVVSALAVVIHNFILAASVKKFLGISTWVLLSPAKTVAAISTIKSQAGQIALRR